MEGISRRAVHANERRWESQSGPDSGAGKISGGEPGSRSLRLRHYGRRNVAVDAGVDAGRKMNAAKFNEFYREYIIDPLTDADFKEQGNRLSFTEQTGELMLIRQRDKWSALSQDTYFTVCVRHVFLRDIDAILNPIYNYPFKIQPSRMTVGFFNSGWHYESFNGIGRWPRDTLDFGQMRDVRSELNQLRASVLDMGRAWLAFLEPAEAFRQIKTYGKSEYCEKMWLEDYARFLQSGPIS